MKKQITLAAAALFLAGSIVFTGCKKDDTTAPVVTLKGASTANVTLGTAYTDEGATADDDRDGDISSSIVVDNPVTASTPTGTYTVTYTATDEAGNVGTATRTVIVKNSSDNFAGTYNVNETCDGTGIGSGTSTVTASSTINNRINIANFALANVTVYANISGSTISIPSQVIGSETYAGSGTISGTTLNINYTTTVGSAVNTCSANYAKQ